MRSPQPLTPESACAIDSREGEMPKRATDDPASVSLVVVGEALRARPARWWRRDGGGCMVAVRVKDVVRAPPSLGDLRATTIDVVTDGRIAPGSRFLFF